MKRFLPWFLPVLLAGGLLTVAPPSRAADKAEEKEKQEKADAISDLITAYKMAEFGRTSKSPEALIAAAGLLRKVSAGRAGKPGPLTEKPVDDDDKPVDAGTLKARGLDEEANEWFRDASDMAAAGDPKVSKAVDLLIKEAKERKYGSDVGTRGALGGPKWVSRPLAPGETHVYNIPFVTGVPAAIGLKSTGSAPMRVKMHVGSYVHFEQVVKFGEYSWVPKPDVAVKTYTIRITNIGRLPTAYTLLTN